MTDYVYGLYAKYYTGDGLEKIFSTKEKALEICNSIKEEMESNR